MRISDVEWKAVVQVQEELLPAASPVRPSLCVLPEAVEVIDTIKIARIVLGQGSPVYVVDQDGRPQKRVTIDIATGRLAERSLPETA